MQIHVIVNPSDTTLVLSGRFDAHEVARFREAVDPALQRPAPVVVVDLAEVVFVDSSALAELVRAMKHARSASGELVLSTPSAPVQVILELTSLDRAFTIRNPAAAGLG